MVKKDYSVGVYHNGKFTPYQSSKSLRADLDSEADPEALKLAIQGVEIHGSYKDGNFRPADPKGRTGYVGKLEAAHGQNLGFNYRGELFRDGKLFGAILKNGKMISVKDYQELVNKDINKAIEDWRSQSDPILTNTYEQLGHIEGELYDTFVSEARRVGLSESRIKQYAHKLSRFNKNLDKRSQKGRGGLEGRIVSGIIAVAGVSAGLSFLSSNITGNVIGNTQSSSNLIGGVLFLIGLVGVFVYFKNK